MEAEAGEEAEGAGALDKAHRHLLQANTDQSAGLDTLPCGLIRLVEKGSKGWRLKRERKLRELAPKFCAHGYKPVMERLVNRVSLLSPCSQEKCMRRCNRQRNKPPIETPELPVYCLKLVFFGYHQRG